MRNTSVFAPPIAILALLTSCAPTSQSIQALDTMTATLELPPTSTPVAPPTSIAVTPGAPMATPIPTLVPGSLAADEPCLVYASDSSGDLDVYLQVLDGRIPYRLTTSPGLDWDPEWSPDGSQIAFVSERDGLFQIYVMNADGSAQRRLATDYESLQPAWSPDGKQIAFAMHRWIKYDLFVIRADGTGLTQWTHDPGQHMWPTWSPDGSLLAFAAYGVTGYDLDWDIYAMSGVQPASEYLYRSSGDPYWRPADLRNLTRSPGEDWGPAWSPDGKTIVFTSQRDGFTQLYTVGADGTNQVRLSSRSFEEFLPAWSPDGKLVIYSASPYQAGNPDVDVFALEFPSGTPRILAKGPGEELTGSWRPVPSQ